MTWMLIRLVLSLGLIAAVLVFASRLAKKRGLGQGNGLIEVVARQRMGRASSVSVLRVAGRVLVIGATDEQVTLLAEMEEDEVQTALAAAPRAAALRPDGTVDPGPATRPTLVARSSSGSLAGSVLDRGAWTTLVQDLRDRTVRR
ncbi:FliO/MopB family protein [Modestobacter lapidis]|nr:FliO/MopB family protein [Modestobacter lapidis]